MLEDEGLLGLIQHQNSVRRRGDVVVSVQTQGQVSFTTQQPQCHRNDQGFFYRLSRRDGAGLLQGKEKTPGSRVVPALCRHQGRARLRIPATELLQIHPGGLLHRAHEILAGHRLAIVALKVKIRPCPKALRAQQRMNHPHHFRTLFINGHGVEVGNFDKRLGPHRVRQRAGIFGKLRIAEHIDVCHALHRGRAHICGKLGIPENGEPLFQAELEPVAAGHPVAGPVVKVLVGDNRLHILELGIRCDLRAAEHTGAVENIQPLVFHRTHVEIINGHNIEDIEVVFAPVHLFVPAHRLLE